MKGGGKRSDFVTALAFIMHKVITVIVQVTNECNLNCKYCYVHKTKCTNHRISISDIRKLIENCSDGFDSVEFCWHGGEPLLVGEEFYEKVLEIQNEIKSIRKIKYRNVIQTNATLLTKRWIKFLKGNDFGIGTSFDAPDPVHSMTRPFRNGVNSLSRMKKSVALLKGCGEKFYPLCVVTKHNVNRASEIFECFKEMGAVSYSLLPVMDRGRNNLSPSNDELTNLYCKTFDLWLEGQHNFKSLQPIETFVKTLLGERPKMCSFSSCCLKRMVTVLPSGEVVPCGSFDDSQFYMGNVFTQRLGEALHSPKGRHLRQQRNQSVVEHCRECKYIAICRGGCRESVLWDSDNYDGKYPFCATRFDTFNYIENRLNLEIESAKKHKSLTM